MGVEKFMEGEDINKWLWLGWVGVEVFREDDNIY